MAELANDEVCAIVDALVREAEDYRDERSKDRIKMMAYFDGEAKDLQKYIPSEVGKSSVVSRDVRAAIKKVLPSIIRTILGSDQVVEYKPVSEGDENSVEQATDYVNSIALEECDGRQAIEDAINDAVRLRNGIIRWRQETTVDVKTSRHSGLDEMAFSQLVAPDDVEVLEYTAREETIEGPEGPVSAPAYDVKIRRRVKNSTPKLSAVALENWLIHPDAVRLKDSPILGEKTRLRRTDLVRMGYDKDLVWTLPSHSSGATEEEDERVTRRRDTTIDQTAPQKALDEVDYYDLLVRVDQDGDGIAELRRVVFAGGIHAKYMLENTEWDEIDYADIVAERRPHQWEGNSVSDDVMEIQTIKTVLLRQTLDNLYWQNNLQPVYQEGVIQNPDSVNNPEFGRPIRVANGVDVRTAISYNVVPMVADKSFSMLAYLDQELEDRTGISDASSGMAPDALQNMTAKASAMVEAAGIGQTEMMVRTIATSLKPVFRGLLKLIIQHQDKPRTVRLRGEWVTYDPRTWNADMDAVVNVGLGAGTRERDMAAMAQVITLQRELLASMGPQVGMQYVSPDNLYNAIAKMTEAAGLKSVGMYFSKPDPQAIQQAMSQKQPSPDEIKAQAAMQLEQMRLQGRMQLEQVKGQQKQSEFGAKMQVEASKEREQLQADLQAEIARLEAQTEMKRQELSAQAALNEQKIGADLEREAIKQQTEREWMDVQQRIASAKLIADAERAAVEEAGRMRDYQMSGNVTGRFVS